jgi:hypothetical protein
MPPLEATENRIQDDLIEVLQTIGTAPAGDWLTGGLEVLVEAGLPADPVPEEPRRQIYLQAIRSEQQAGETGVAERRVHAVFQVACIAREADATAALRMLFNLKADVLRAIYRNESVFTSPPWGYGIWPMNFTYHADASSAGLAIGVQELFVDAEIATTMP